MKTVARSGAPISTCTEDAVCMPLVCETCKTEIPRSAAATFEGGDYAVHFCGLGCLETWKAHYWKAPPADQAR